MSLLWSLLPVPLLIALNAFFVVAEYAVVAIRPNQIQSIRHRGWRRAADAMSRLKADPTGAIGAIQVCITMTNLLLGWIGEPAMSAILQRLFSPLIQWSPETFGPVAIALSFLVVTFLTVVLSELLPKAMTLRYVEYAAILIAVPIRTIRQILRPLVWLMNLMANAVTVPLGFGRVDALESQHVTIDELRMMAKQAADEGSLTLRERALILNSLALGRRSAREIKVPRTRVAYLDLQWTMEENHQVVEQHLHTRLPLCEGGLDNVVGIVTSREFLKAYHAKGDTSALRLIAKPPVFAPERILLDNLLTLLREKRTQMVLLIDEYGGIQGIVTLQDVVDELFHVVSQPSSEQTALEPQVAPGRLLLSADTPLHEMREQYPYVSWGTSESVATLGGWVVAHVGRVPQPGDRITIHGVEVEILEADHRSVHRLALTLSPEVTGEDRT